MQTILVIDDDPAQVKMIEMTLWEAKYRPVTATNGEEGLKAFRQHQPDLVVLDVMMPGMDGWETCYRIRQISTVPIIVTERDGRAPRGRAQQRCLSAAASRSPRRAGCARRAGPWSP